MSFDVEESVLYRIGNAPVLPYPYPHFYVSDVFPPDFYQALLEHLPPLSAYTRIDETGTVAKGHYQERYIAGLEEFEERESTTPESDAFWHQLSTWLMSERFSQLILQKFSSTIDARFGAETRLGIESETRFVRDFTNYAIPPHTDSPRKLVSLLFYLPKDESLASNGTSIYQPLDPHFTCDGTRHHQFKQFKKVMTARFLPNSLFAFVKTPNAFHGVEKIEAENVERDLMLYNIYVNKTVKSDPKRGGFLRFLNK